MSRTLVTSALPYANGPIHFGHVVGAYLPADVYTRFLRLCGEEALFVCGTDEYGVAITIGAEREGTAYPEYVARWHAEIARTFDRLGIEFDIFSGTSTCPFHAETAQDFFRRLDANGFLQKKETEQLYSESRQRFLADRYVVGRCPKCDYAEARGDECPSCGNWLDPLDLGAPRSRIDGEALVRRRTTHWYLDLPALRDRYLGEWFESKSWKPNVEAFVRQQLADIQPRPITRDLPWGVPVPAELAGTEVGKVLYVWFDAPIGYVSMTRELFERRGDPGAWERWWKSEDTRLVHFIGKDNIPFHCVVFPSMLFGVDAGYIRPWAVPANEFYNLQGSKFSTSGGWSIPLDEFFESYDPEVARFHLIASSPETADSEWRWEEFQRTSAELADKIGNLATRVLRFVDKHFEGRIPAMAEAHRAEFDALLLEGCGAHGDPGEHLRAFRFRRAAEQILANATVGNVFVDQSAPWGLRKTDPERCASALRQCCEWIALVARWCRPFMPGKALALWRMLGGSDESLDAAGWPALPRPGAWHALETGRRLGEVGALFAKLDDERIQAEVEALAARA